LVEWAGWPAVFWARAPIVLAALALSWLIPPGGVQGSIRGFDAAGAGLLVIWMSALLLAFAVDVAQVGVSSLVALALLAALAFVAFVVHELRHPQPLIRLALFRDAQFAVMNAASIGVNLAAFAVLLLVPYYLLRVAALDVTAGGTILAAGAAGTILGSWIAGRAVARVGIRLLALAGVALSLAGLSVVSGWEPATPLAVLIASLVVQGIGVGLFQVAYADLVLATLPVADRGIAGSLTMVTRTIGVVGGATALSAAFRHFEGASLAAGAPPAQAFLSGFQSTFICAAACTALCFAIAAVRRRTAR
ncbi:MAG TPA: hypothetical protein VJ740_00530, partial [Hyphomicrobiaceae bacterium]|nr:hypothetical protein [Hyphomicrobiaceae bacterium]